MWYKAGKIVPLLFNKTQTELYEANIPPLLRYFHIQNISPSGWIEIPNKYIKDTFTKTTTCTYEYTVDYDAIIPLNDKETLVPYKICSFDIEASSSHGDFPIPIKNYKKLATNIVDYFQNSNTEICENLLKSIIYNAFNLQHLL